MVTVTGFKKRNKFLSRTHSQKTGDIGLTPSGYWKGPYRATPMSMVILSPSEMAPLGISRLKSLEVSKYFTPSLVHSESVAVGFTHSGVIFERNFAGKST
jgi:hypothetical protein